MVGSRFKPGEAEQPASFFLFPPCLPGTNQTGRPFWTPITSPPELSTAVSGHCFVCVDPLTCTVFISPLAGPGVLAVKVDGRMTVTNAPVPGGGGGLNVRIGWWTSRWQLAGLRTGAVAGGSPSRATEAKGDDRTGGRGRGRTTSSVG